jgi:ParB-like chromosome segregation protein Spo0J
MAKPLNGTLAQHPIDALDLRYADLRLPSPQAVARLREEVEQEGLRNPLLVSNGVEQDKLVVIDGFKRIQVARDLGETQLAVRIVGLAAVAAQVAILQANPPQRGLSDFEAGLIVERLHRKHGLTQVEIAELLGRHKTWVCRRLSLVERVEPQVQEDLRLGLTSAGVVRELVQLPHGTQAAAAKAITAHRLSTRQAAQLVAVLRVADPTERADILARPQEHLPEGRDAGRYGPDPRLGPRANQVRQGLLGFGAASHRVIETVRSHDPGTFRPAEARILAELGRRVLTPARDALAGVERVLSSPERREHVESRTPTGAGV